MELPNFVNTWSVYFKSELDLLDFSEWLVRENEKGNVYSSINCAKARYLGGLRPFQRKVQREPTALYL
ncbi:hypothetical protein ACNO5E_15885 [Vibrio parahaemolyticus]